MNDSHISRLSELKEKLKDLGSNLGDSVICSEPFKFFFCVLWGQVENQEGMWPSMHGEPQIQPASPEFGGWVG